MNWLSALNFALSALNFVVMILGISSGSWTFVINLVVGILCLLAGIMALDK